MVKDTKRDRVWRAILELEADPPTYTLHYAKRPPSARVVGFSKADIELRTGDGVSKRTIHDTVMTAVEYGLLEMVKSPSYASVGKHPITGDRCQLDVYRLSTADGRASVAGAAQSDA